MIDVICHKLGLTRHEAGSFYLDRQPQKTILASWTSNSKKEVEEMVAALGAATSS